MRKILINQWMQFCMSEGTIVEIIVMLRSFDYSKPFLKYQF